jgi:hypothetical protein
MRMPVYPISWLWLTKQKITLTAVAAMIASSSAQSSQSFYMNIYANEDCNSYKSTQQLGDGFDTSGGCIDIDWAESWAVDVKNVVASAICFTRTYANEGCSGLITNYQGSNSNTGCQDSPVGCS